MFHFLQRLIGQWSVSRKLILIYALDLSAVIFVSAILINEKFIAINFARKETVGNAYISEVRRALPMLDTGVGGGQSSGMPARLVLDAEERHGQGLGTRELASNLARHLDSGLPSEKRKQDLAVAVQSLVTRIGNQSNLILDPDLDSYYTMSLVVLRFPELYGLGMRIGDKALAAGMATSQSARVKHQTEYLIIEGRLDAVARGIAADYEEGVAAGGVEFGSVLNPSKEALLAAIEGLRAETRRVAIDLNDKDSRVMINKVTGKLMESLSTSWKVAGTALDELLRKRIDDLFTRMWLHLGTAASLLLLILTVVFFVARMIALPIRRLSDVAEKVSFSADYSLRAVWSSSDELGRLVNAFNLMLEKLDRSRRVEQELAASTRAADAQKELLEAIPIPLMVTSIPRHEVLHTNQPAVGWLQQRTTDPWRKGLDASHRVRFFQQLADRGEVNELEVLWNDGKEEHWALLSARRLFYQNQDAVLTAFTPIGRIKQMESRLELWAKVFESSSESIMVTNAEREIVTINRAFCRATGYELSEIAGEKPTFLRSDRHPEGFFEQLWKTASQRGSWQGELWIRRKSGDTFPVWTVVNAVRDNKGCVTHYVATALDISERKEHERRISHLAHHDPLTDLPNRTLCLDRLAVAIQQAERSQRRVGVLFLDLDRFKNINDSLGHHVGDGLLRSVARCLLDVVRSGDTVSRLGGDEFVVIFNGIADGDEVGHIVENRLIPLIRKPHDVNGAELHISCSVGVAVYPEDGQNVETLMRNADAAMYQAKIEGRNNARFFTAEMDRCARERMEIEQDLRTAVERGEFRLYFQPRVDTATARLVGVEALLRWQHPELGMVSPSRFIPIAEESGQIIPIGYWVFSEACRLQALWQRTGHGIIPVSVNLSAGQFCDEGLLDTLRTSLALHQVGPSQIELELTESLLMEDMERVVEILHEIKSIGISLSVDDFGTGYSSLNYLYRFPIDKLKIDQSFVSDMLENPKDMAITQAIIGLGHTLGLRVVAEGVENVEQYQALSAAGCDELQGYYFSKPMSADDFILWKNQSIHAGSEQGASNERIRIAGTSSF